MGRPPGLMRLMEGAGPGLLQRLEYSMRAGGGQGEFEECLEA